RPRGPVAGTCHAGGPAGRGGQLAARMTRADHRLIAAAAVLATSVFLLGIGRTDLWPPDETRVAEISREMLDHGHWLLPRLNGRPFIEEPPLFYWLQAGRFPSSGRRSPRAARAPRPPRPARAAAARPPL